MGKSKTNEHRFFCVKCGTETPLARKRGQQKEKFHRKKLWCYHCKEEINHIECRNDYEVIEFKENYKKGLYANEIEESLDHCRDSSKGQNLIFIDFKKIYNKKGENV